MRLKWSVCFPLIQCLIALSLMICEEAHYWEHYQDWQARQDKSGQPYTPLLTGPFTVSLDFGLNDREQIVHYLNLPVSIVIGWYSVPRLNYDSVLGPLLLRATWSLSVKARILLLDVLFLFGVWLQWRIVGLALERTLAHSRFFRRLTIFFSLASCGMAIAALAIARSWVLEHYVGPFLHVTLFFTVLASLLILGTATISIPIWAIKQLRSRNKAPQVSEAQ